MTLDQIKRKVTLTKWEVGQNLIYCADLLGEKEGELRAHGYLELAEILRGARLKIGTEFNALKSHSFELPSEEEP